MSLWECKSIPYSLNDSHFRKCLGSYCVEPTAIVEPTAFTMIIPPFILALICIIKDQIGAWKRYQFAYTFLFVFMHISTSGFVMLSLPSLYWFDLDLCSPSTIFNFSSYLSIIRAWFCIQSLEHCQYLPIPNLPKLSSKLVSPWSFPHLRWENTIYLFLCIYFLCYWVYTLFPWCLKNKFPTGCLFLKNLICSLIPGYKVKPN